MVVVKLKCFSPALSIQQASNLSLETSMPRKYLKTVLLKALAIAPPPVFAGLMQDLPPYQSSFVTRIQRPNHLIMALGGRGHTVLRIL
jgi:hypothetical protein